MSVWRYTGHTYVHGGILAGNLGAWLPRNNQNNPSRRIFATLGPEEREEKEEGRRVLYFLTWPADHPPTHPPTPTPTPPSREWIVSQQPLVGSSSNFKLILRGPNQHQKCLKWRRSPMEDDLNRKRTSNGRWPQNIKTWISQQPLIRSSSNFKPKLRGPN